MSKRPFPNSTLYKFKNCRVIREHAIISEDVWVRDGKILDPRNVFWEERSLAGVDVDCHNLIVSPGFIDLQINGGFGIDFSSEPDKLDHGVRKVAKGLLQHGVTSFCPTIVTSSQESYLKILPKIKKCKGGSNGAEILGVHLEGPFINPLKKGAHPEHLIYTGTVSGINDIERIYGSLEDAVIITMAPEKGNTHVFEEIVQRGIVVSIGHSTANFNQAESAANEGASFITHLFNAMLPFHHRDPGIVGLLTSDNIPKPIFYGLIADGVHTHPTSARIAHRSHPDGLVLVTDAIAALGLPRGKHKLGEMTVETNSDKATLANSTTLAGSIATMEYCVQKFRKMSGCSIVEALEGATLHPAQVLGIQHKKGTVDFDTDADLVLLDDRLFVQATFIAGEPVWIRNTSPVATELLKKYHLSRDIFNGV